MKDRFLLIFVLLAINTSCTSYGEMGFTGGVSSYQLSDNSYKVFAKGNAFASKEKMEMFVMLKSAELAKENGFKSFSFLDSHSGYSTSFYTTNTPGTFSGSSYGTSYGGVYNSSFSGSYTAPQTEVHQYNKPSSDAIVVMYKNNEGMFKANTIIKNLAHLKESKTKNIENNN